MLLFSTILSINEKMTRDDFIRLVIEWNQNSPHKENVIPNLTWNGEHNIRFGDKYLWLDIEEYRNKSIIAVRYEKCEADGVVWDTDFIMNFKEKKMSIHLNRVYTEDASIDNPGFSTPHFITLLIERGYLKDDGDLPVQNTPHVINEENLDLVVNVIKGIKKYRLPVVYISRTYYDENPVDVNRLASRLKGVAHVLVQESTQTNPRLKELCDAANEYYGAVGIYYPNQTLGHKKYLYRSAVGYDSFLQEKITRYVIKYSSEQMVDTLYTWYGVNNALLMDRLQSNRAEKMAAETAQRKAEAEKSLMIESLNEEEQRVRKQAYEQGRAEADELLEKFDDEMERLRRQVEVLTKANEALQYENQGLRTKLNSNDSIPVLYMGDEFEFYPGEIKDLLLSVLTEFKANLAPESRRLDIVEDILINNNYERISEKRMEDIKRLLKNYNGMSAKLKQSLLDFGFEITEDGKHYKLTYYGDGRYSTSVSKTPSDVRTGKNMSLQIIRSML